MLASSNIIKISESNAELILQTIFRSFRLLLDNLISSNNNIFKNQNKELEFICKWIVMEIDGNQSNILYCIYYNIYINKNSNLLKVMMNFSIHKFFCTNKII